MSDRERPMMTRREVLEAHAGASLQEFCYYAAGRDNTWERGFVVALRTVLGYRTWEQVDAAHELALLMAGEREVAAE